MFKILNFAQHIQYKYKYNFLSKFKSCKKSEDNFIANRKFTSMKKTFVIFIELCMKGDPSLKGNNHHKSS